MTGLPSKEAKAGNVWDIAAIASCHMGNVAVAIATPITQASGSNITFSTIFTFLALNTPNYSLLLLVYHILRLMSNRYHM